MKITCRVCQRETHRIVPAHLATHGMTMAEYRADYPDASLLSEECSAALSAKQKAVQGTPEARQRMSEACSKVVKTPEWNRKNSEAQKGKTIPPDVKAKMSVSAKIRIARDGNPMDKPGVAAKVTASNKDPVAMRKRSEGQAKSYGNGWDKLNESVATVLAICVKEPFVREFLFPTGVPHRYDFAFPEKKVVLEVQGCRWHFCVLHPCQGGLTEGQRTKRISHDKRKATYAKNQGWAYLSVWEHDLKNPLQIQETLTKLLAPVLAQQVST